MMSVGDGAEAGSGQGAIFDLPHATVAIAGGGLFPVRRIYCIGRNYAEHAREMGADPKSEPPFFFQKPADAVQNVAAGMIGTHAYPPLTENYHHEVELVVFLRSGGRDIAASDALDHIFGYAIGLDMTRRDQQQRMKDGRKPWEIGKSFDHSAPIGPISPVEVVGHLGRGTIRLSVNGTLKQTDDLQSMIWSVAEQIVELSKGSALTAGDIIFSGTPAGVGPVERGDEILAQIAGLQDLRLKIA